MSDSSFPQKVIFVSISNPLVVRNFLLIPGGVLSVFKKEGLRIILLVPEPARDQVKKDFENGTVTVEPLIVNWKRTVPQHIYTFFATYLVFTEMQQLLAKYGTRADIPAAGGKSFLYPLKFAISRTLGRWKWFKNTLMPRVGMLVYHERPYRKLFETYKPDLVFLPDFHSIQDTALLREAKRQRVRTIGMPGSWDHFVKKFEPLKLDRLLVWNEPVKNEAVMLQGYAEKDVYVTGAPYYDLFVRKDLLLSRGEFCNKYGLDSKKKMIFFGSRGRYTPNDGDIVAILLDAIKRNQFVQGAQIFVRPYPGARLEEEEKFLRFEDESLVYNDWIEQHKIFGHSGFTWYPSLDDLVHFVNCLHHADIIINTYSSISIEGSVFLKPIININFDGYDQKPYKRSVRRFENLSHFRYVNETRGIMPVSDKEELISTINTFLENPDSNRRNVEVLRDKMCYKADGKAGERIADYVLESLSYS